MTYAECGSGSMNESDSGWVVVDQLRMTPRAKPAAAAAAQPPLVTASQSGLPFRCLTIAS